MNLSEQFSLNTILERDTLPVCNLSLSSLRLMNASQLQWFILIPRQPNLTEIFQLSQEDRYQLITESCLVSEALTHLFLPDKLNVAAIGNLVPQLHLHLVCRYQHDEFWPSPIWGKITPCPYEPTHAKNLISDMVSYLRTRTDQVHL